MQAPFRIILVEDDPLQAEWLVDDVIKPTLSSIELRYFDSEHLFIKAIESGALQQWDPHFAIFDLYISYYSLDDLAEMASSPDLNNLSPPKAAGIRCRDTLQTVCPNVKCGIVTVLDEAPDGFVFRKGTDDDETLITFLKQPLR